MRVILLARTAALAALLAAGASGDAAADPKAGRAKTLQCQTCHGIDGLSKVPDAPNLAGQPELYLVKELRAYRAGTRQHEIMATIAKGLSDRDIADLAAWYASLEVTVKAPP